LDTIRIANKEIGGKNPVFIIAEAGVNHNGDINLAKELVDAAKKAGADAVKFQTFKAEGLVTSDAIPAYYATKNLGKQVSQQDMIRKLELNYTDFVEIKKYCDKKNIIFLSTPHSFDAIDFLERLVPAYKFGSGDLTNIPALVYTAKKQKPIILGTGMATLDEVKKAVNEIKSQGNNQIIALHCTTNYPCSLEEVNLLAMQTMKSELNCIVGYSDHTLGSLASVIAVSLGAKIIEKHFTIDKNLPGPDHKASIDINELTEMIKTIRNVEKILGSDKKRPTKSEEKIKDNVRKSLIANKKIEKGTTIKKEMIVIKRPGTGLKPYEMEKIIGRKAKRNILEDEIIELNMVE
jgi:N-acetylneuraminate synthase/N,N'-diacetyllegionaminate synthase